MRTFGKWPKNDPINKATQIITVNESLAEFFKMTYGVSEVTVVMNFPPITAHAKENRIDFRSLYSFSDNDKILIYQGTLNKGRGLELAIKSMNYLPKNVKLIILGNGILKNELIELSIILNLQNRIKFIDTVSLEKLPGYTSGADFGINLLEDINLSKKLASPNKLFEYLHAGIPVICSNSVENKK